MPPKRKPKTAPNDSMPLGSHGNKENINQGVDDGVQKDIVAQLEEQIRALTVENQTLRRELERQQQEKTSPAVSTPKSRRGRLLSTIATPQRKYSSPSVTLSKPKEKGCACTGNCSSRKCGCVKKDIYCAVDFCKCSNSCTNTKPLSDVEDNHDDEDENGDEDDDEASKPDSNNKNVTITKKSIFDPDQSGSSGSSATSPDIKQKSNDNSYNVSTQTDDELIDPMKPTRQLARSPPGSVKQSTNLDISMSHNGIVRNLNFSLSKTEVKIPEDLIDAEVADWEEHQAQLIPCSKCNRRFFPQRVDVHERSCLQI